MLCREIIITLAQTVYDPVKHISTYLLKLSRSYTVHEEENKCK
jgi:hypothetical protein